MNVFGIDIGYSNLKIAFGQPTSAPMTRLRPAGAAPADRFGARIDGQQHADYLHVLVNEQDYIAGVSSDRAELWSRALHADYPATDSYLALFHAGLLLSGMNYVELLVTGLPVSQYFDEQRRLAVVNRLRGTHHVAHKRDVLVGEVRVVPQPVGGLLDYISQRNVDLDDARVLVIDPGFFSLDWITVSRGTLQQGASGTSHNASSVVLEEAAKGIGKDFGATVRLESLEDAIRQGKTHILVRGQLVPLAEYIDQASRKMGQVVANEIQTKLRGDTQGADLVVLVGGGAPLFKDVLQSTFSQLKVEVPSEPVLSNARGFWTLGASGAKG